MIYAQNTDVNVDAMVRVLVEPLEKFLSSILNTI